MSQAGPRPSAFYVERELLTRLPATPAALSDRSSSFSFGQQAPAEGNPLPGDGLVLAGLFAIVVSVYAWAGQTLSGAGTLNCWLYNPFEAVWTRMPDLDQTVTATSRAQSFAAIQVLARTGTLVNFLASSVTVSGGTDVLVRIDGFESTGPRGS